MDLGCEFSTNLEEATEEEIETALAAAKEAEEAMIMAEETVGTTREVVSGIVKKIAEEKAEERAEERAEEKAEEKAEEIAEEEEATLARAMAEDKEGLEDANFYDISEERMRELEQKMREARAEGDEKAADSYIQRMTVLRGHLLEKCLETNYFERQKAEEEERKKREYRDTRRKIKKWARGHHLINQGLKKDLPSYEVYFPFHEEVYDGHGQGARGFRPLEIAGYSRSHEGHPVRNFQRRELEEQEWRVTHPHCMTIEDRWQLEEQDEKRRRVAYLRFQEQREKERHRREDEARALRRARRRVGRQPLKTEVPRTIYVEKECRICLCLLTEGEVIGFPCGHVLHKKCFDEMPEETKGCVYHCGSS